MELDVTNKLDGYGATVTVFCSLGGGQKGSFDNKIPSVRVLAAQHLLDAIPRSSVIERGDGNRSPMSRPTFVLLCCVLSADCEHGRVYIAGVAWERNDKLVLGESF